MGLEVLDPVRVAGWQREVTVVAVAAQGPGQGSSSCSQGHRPKSKTLLLNQNLQEANLQNLLTILGSWCGAGMA